jgi:hypothetical protein
MFTEFIRQKEAAKTILILLLFGGVFACLKTCNEKTHELSSYRKQADQIAKSLQDTRRELTLNTFKLRAKDDSIAVLAAKILNIKPSGVIAYKRIEVEKIIEGDTLYEIEEVEIPAGTRFTYKFDECSEVEFEWGTPAKWKLKRNLKLTDVSYFERRNLWGVKHFPKWGKKQYSQVLLTNCNDSVLVNKNITFTKKP